MASTLSPARSVAAAAALAAVVTLAACDLFDVGHDNVTIEIDSSDDSPVRVITSSEFRVGFDTDNREIFDLITSDTAWVDVPYRETFDLAPSGRFYVRAMEAENPDAVVSVRALVDGEETFFHETVLTGEGTQFYYRGR